jgi:hypothetical protein
MRNVKWAIGNDFLPYGLGGGARRLSHLFPKGHMA